VCQNALIHKKLISLSLTLSLSLSLRQVEYRVLMQQQSTGASLKTDLLIQRPFLRTQTMATLAALADQMWLHVYVEGSAVVSLGEEGGSLFLVKTGRCVVRMNDGVLRGVVGEYEVRAR
jgi:hypothetical protein